MLGIGEELKKTRVERGLSIEDVERETKIKASFIQAIENEEFDKIPGRVYVKGFIKNYAKLFGLNYTIYLQKINEYYDEEKKEDILANSKPELIREIEDKPLSTRILKAVAITMVFLLLAWGVNKAYVHFSDEPADAPQLTQQDPTPPVTPPDDAEEPAEDPLIDEELYEDQVVMDLIMSEGGPGLDACWVQVVVDGALAFEETISSGREPMQFIGQESISITYGNAGAITLIVNGEDQGDLGGPGEVGTRDFLLEDLSN